MWPNNYCSIPCDKVEAVGPLHQIPGKEESPNRPTRLKRRAGDRCRQMDCDPIDQDVSAPPSGGVNSDTSSGDTVNDIDGSKDTKQGDRERMGAESQA